MYLDDEILKRIGAAYVSLCKRHKRCRIIPLLSTSKRMFDLVAPLFYAHLRSVEEQLSSLPPTDFFFYALLVHIQSEKTHFLTCTDPNCARRKGGCSC